jgi:hypothetical protein
MNQILEHMQPCYESDVEELLLLAADQFAGDFVTGIHFVFTRPDLTDRAEVQIYSGYGCQNEARANLREQFQAGRACMGGCLMFSYNVPWRTFVFPAYRAALKAKRKRQLVGGDGE